MIAILLWTFLVLAWFALCIASQHLILHTALVRNWSRVQFLAAMVLSALVGVAGFLGMLAWGATL